MTESSVYPQEFELDTVNSGVARILCHWDIETTLLDDTVLYSYEEAVINWVLPETFVKDAVTITISSRDDVIDYISLNSEEIMSFAKSTKLTM